MKKLLVIGLAVSMVLALATMGMATSVVDTVIDGNNGSFDIYTTMKHLPYDHFHGESTGAMNAWQTSRVGSSSEWASDGADIDRYGDFAGGGELRVNSEWDSLGTQSWDWGHSEFYSYVVSDDTGYLGQKTHWGSNWGGVNDVDQYKKQRNMDIGAACVYDIRFGARDLRATAPGNWDFTFSAEGEGDADLHVDSFYSTYQHNPGSPYYGPYDGLNVKGENRGNAPYPPYTPGYTFDWTGDLDQDTYARGDRGYNFYEDVDLDIDYMWGDLALW